MNKKVIKFGSLLAIALSAVACGEKVDVLTEAGTYVWSMYKDTEGICTGTFDVVTTTVYDGKKVGVEWEINVPESMKDAIKIIDSAKGANFKTIYVGYYDGLISEETSWSLTPKFTYGEETKTLVEIAGEEKGIFNYTTPSLSLNTHDDWTAYVKGTTYNIKGKVIDVIDPDGSSSSKGSFYFQDTEGNGYYAYKPSGSTVNPGDGVVVTGIRSDYSGQEEFGQGCTYGVTSDSNEFVWLDGTSDFKKASSNKSFNAKYQNTLIELKNCSPTRSTGAYYYFTVDGGKTEYNLYYSTYFLTEEQNNAWKQAFNDAIDNGSTFDIKGVGTVYSSAIQIYPTVAAPEVFYNVKTMTAEEKKASCDEVIKSAVASKFSSAGEVKISMPKYASITGYEVTSGTTASVVEGKLMVSPAALAVTNSVKVSYKIGDNSYDITVDVKTTSTTEMQVIPAAKIEAGRSYVLYTVGSGTASVATGKQTNITGWDGKNYFTSTTTTVDLAYINVESTTGGYFLSLTVDGAKKYVTVNASGKLELADAGSNVWVYNADYNTVTTKIGEVDYYIGTYSTAKYETIGSSKLSYLSSSNYDKTQYPIHFANYVAKDVSAINTLQADTVAYVNGYIGAFDGSGRAVIVDSTGYITYWSKALKNCEIGTAVKIGGNITTYNGLLQLAEANSQVVEIGEKGTVPSLTAVELSSNDFVSYFKVGGEFDATNTNSKYFKVTGATLAKSGSFWNATAADGSTIQLQLGTGCEGKSTVCVDANNGAEIVLEGYSYGTNGSTARLTVTKISLAA